MTAYYVLGITFVLFALGLTAVGLTRENFPPTRGGGRALMAIAGLIAVVTYAVLVSTSEKEHPREEAAKKAAEKKAEAQPPPKPESGKKGGGTVNVVEKEFSIKLAGGNSLASGSYKFAVANQGKIPHDLEVQGAGTEAKTPLIQGGKKAELKVDLEPGKYKVYCTVPGHEQLGMKQDVTVQ